MSQADPPRQNEPCQLLQSRVYYRALRVFNALDWGRKLTNMLLTIVFGATAFAADCDVDNCKTVEVGLLDGAKLSALEVIVNDEQRTYVNPRVNLSGLDLPLAESLYINGYEGNNDGLCHLLSGGELPDSQARAMANNKTSYLFEDKDWAPKKKDYNYARAKAFIIVGEINFEDKDGKKLATFFVSSMKHRPEIIATLLCAK